MAGRTSRDQRTGCVAQTEQELERRGDTASRLGSDGAGGARLGRGRWASGLDARVEGVLLTAPVSL